MILDTAFVIDVMDGDDDAIQASEKYEDASEQQYLSAITVLELYEGVVRAMHSDASSQREAKSTAKTVPSQRRH